MKDHSIVRLLIFLAVLSICDGYTHSPSFKTRSTPQQKAKIQQKFHSEAKKSSVVLIDVENVRGKSGFTLTHSDILQSTSIWANHYGLNQRTSLIIDHGSIPSGYYLPNEGLSIVFAGTKFKADDVIVRDISFFQRLVKVESIVVVTADRELIMRCKRASSRRLAVIEPVSFLDDLERVMNEEHGNLSILKNSESSLNEENDTKEVESVNHDKNDENTEMMKHMELEVHLGARLINAESQLRNNKKKKISPKKRKKIQKEANRIRAKLAQIGPSTLQGATSILSNGKLDPKQQRILLDKWELLRKSSGRKEVTGDRIILAERLRRELEEEIVRSKASEGFRLEEIMDSKNENSDVEAVVNRKFNQSNKSEIAKKIHSRKMNPSEAHVYYVNSMLTEKQKEENESYLSMSDPILNDMISNETTKNNFSLQFNDKAPSSISKAQKHSPEMSAKSSSPLSVPSTLSENGSLSMEAGVKSITTTIEDDVDSTKVRFVVVSDTHGYEESLTRDDVLEPWTLSSSAGSSPPQSQESNVLPYGDVLLHLGDFAIDGPKVAQQKALQRFDKWLSQQPHPTKIIVRGNHDPMQIKFPLSNAKYVNKPTTIKVRNSSHLNGNDEYNKETKNDPFIKLAVVPYGGFSRSKSHRRKRQRSPSTSIQTLNKNLFPSWCDVLASHEPPRGILDKCISGQRAGNPMLRKAVECMDGDPPKLWICGHIHEGRGYRHVTFGTGNVRRSSSHSSQEEQKSSQKFQKRRETLVMNAANANPGRAKELVYGPLVVDVSSKYEEKVEIGSASVEKQNSTFKTISATFSTALDTHYDEVSIPKSKQSDRHPQTHTKLLLAIDLGLKCGASLYDDQGKLIWYEQLQFLDTEDVTRRIPELLKKWEGMCDTNVEHNERSDAELLDTSNSSHENEGKLTKLKKISYLAIEGGYGELWDAWSTATIHHHSSDRSSTHDSSSIEILNIRPEEWRSHLLLPKERSNSRSCKEAARLIARQIVYKFGDDHIESHTGKFKTDVAESVSMGFYVAHNHLGWINQQQQQIDGIPRRPLIDRYMNGQIMVPK